MAIPHEVIEDIKYRNEIENTISQYVNLKRRGKNLVGLCPFHSEKTPSFTVYPENGSFYCFGCGVGGGIKIDLVFVNRGGIFPLNGRGGSRFCGDSFRRSGGFRGAAALRGRTSAGGGRTAPDGGRAISAGGSRSRVSNRRGGGRGTVPRTVSGGGLFGICGRGGGILPCRLGIVKGNAVLRGDCFLSHGGAALPR